MSIRQSLLVSVAVGATLAGGGVASAQSAGPPPGAEAQASGEVIVTAEKRAQSIEKVPVAVSAYTSKQRDIIGIQTIQDLTDFTPGFAYSTSLDRAFIRGVGRQTNNLSTQPGVATYVDGVYNSSVTAAAGDTLFLDRTEILRGPQGTLYGRNAIGGAINAISREPSNTFYSEGRATFGNYGVYDGEAAVSGPINDNLRLRLAGEYNNQDQGYFKNVAGGPSEGGSGHNWYVEGQLDANITPQLEAWVKADAFGYDSTYRASNNNAPYDTDYTLLGSLGPNALFAYNPCFGVAQTIACTNLENPSGFGIGGTYTQVGNVTTNPGITNIRNFNTATPEHANTTDDYNIDVHLTYHTPWDFDIKYVGGYTHYKYHLTTNYDDSAVTSMTIPCAPGAFLCAGPTVIYPTTIFNYFEDKTYFSNEVNLASTGNGNLQWIVGAYQYEEFYGQHIDFPSPRQTELANPVSALTFLPAAPNPNLSYYYAGQQMKEDSYAGFGQLDWKITDQLKLTGGVRYSSDTLSGTEYFRAISWGTSLSALQTFGASPVFNPALDITPFLIYGVLPGQTSPGPGVKSAPRLLANGWWARNLGQTWSSPTGTAGLEWTPDNETLIYAKYSRGYKSGGFNAGYLYQAPETAPETLDAYEIGAKRQWFDRKLTTNISLFYYNYDGMQIPLSVQPTSGPSQTIVYNMKQVVSYGVELETIWAPIEHAQIIFDYSYLNATIHDPNCFLDAADPDAQAPGANSKGCPAPTSATGIFPNQFQKVNGQQVPESAPNKIALNGNYTFMFEPGSLTLSASYIWKDQTYDSIFNRAYSLAPSYSQVDLTATFNDVKNRYTIILFGKNVFNTLGYDGVAGYRLNNEPYALYKTFGLIPPATYGVQLQFRFR
jgi:iron complex outermembrane receptor protein